MKKVFLFGAFAAALSLFSSCSKETVIGDGPVVTETRSVNNFRGLSSGIPGKVNFTIDPVYKVEIRAQQNILEVMRTEVVNGILEISFRYNVRVRRHEDIIVNISGPSADLIRLSGSGDINVDGNVIANQLDLEVSGSGSIAVQRAVINDKIDARISGSGNISVAAGSGKNEELRITGSGSMDLSNVPAEKAETRISGSGDLKVNLSQNLDVHISGSGSVYYYGNPVINTHISGSGKVKPL